MSDLSDLKPCPHCGNEWPFRYISAFVAVLECTDCGAAMKDAAVSVLYRRDRVPPGLVDQTYEATALKIRNADGSETPHPDHGYVGVNVVTAFLHSGALERWNRRAPIACEPLT